jgi:DNA-binding MarR family transcriptional regulator
MAAQHLVPFFRRFDLQAGEFDVLATLRRSGSPYSLAPTHLFKALMVSSGGMTNRLDRLEKAGLIARTPNPEDRRGTLVSLTEKGISLINTMMPLHVDNEMKALSALSREEQQTLNLLLEKLIAGLTSS